MLRTKNCMKSPSSILDWEFNWRVINDDEKLPWLREDEDITEYEITVDTGITLVEHVENNGAITVWISGGEPNKSYFISCKITTSEKRTDTRYILLKILER